MAGASEVAVENVSGRGNIWAHEGHASVVLQRTANGYPNAVFSTDGVITSRGGKPIMSGFPTSPLRLVPPKVLKKWTEQKLEECKALRGRCDIPDPAALVLDHPLDTVTVNGVVPARANPEVVNQRYIGDCWYAAPVAAATVADPTFLSRNIRDRGNGVFDVTLYERNARGQLVPAVYTTDNDFYGTTGQQYSGTPRSSEGANITYPLYEKAFAASKGGYEALGNGGIPARGLEAVWGTPTRSLSPSTSSTEQIQELLLTASKNKWPMVFGTYPEFDHAYALVDAHLDGNELKVTLELYNPHGIRAPVYGVQDLKKMIETMSWTEHKRDPETGEVVRIDARP